VVVTAVHFGNSGRRRMMDAHPVLECQQCGRVLRHLTYAEAQKIADNPYDYVFICGDCTPRRGWGF
jgi:hypothetical protein